ncbi:S-methyl-5'-thioadenosine phosphorylase [bacterium]|nr:S-methyl-5'-thioadenosine phosphorylase [bacterium]
MTEQKAEIGIFGGSGFYEFLDKTEEIVVETPYGAPSSPVTLGEIEGRKVAFLPRHGKAHQYPPQAINYRANAWAMNDLGVRMVIGPCASGSLQPNIKPGDFLICDQFVDRTTGRKDTFYNGPITTHLSMSDPYCPELRKVAIEVSKEQGIVVHDSGTVVVIQGPRFSTRSESKWFSSMGWEVINMTQYPEVYLCRELDMCYLNISLITDYDVGLDGDPNIKPVTHEEVIRVFTENNEKLKKLLFGIVPRMPKVEDLTCNCQDLVSKSRF